MSSPDPKPADIRLPAPLTPSSSPMDVARCEAISLSDRRALLMEWREDALALERAAGEGMTGGSLPDEPPAKPVPSRLKEVTAALQALDLLDAEALDA